MTLPDLSVYLEKTIQRCDLISLIYLERCIDKAKTDGPSLTRRAEAESILKELKVKVDSGHKDSEVLKEVLSVFGPAIHALGF